MTDNKESSDFITKISQTQRGLDFDPFPEIPDPPPGWNPENNPLRTDGVSPPPPDYAKPKSKQEMYIPYARVFLVGEDGNPDFESVLRKGAAGDVMIAKKEVADMKGSVAFKVYMEWLEPVDKY